MDYLPDIEKSLEINQSACSWTARAISVLRDRLKVNIKLHDPDTAIHSGEIFLFNHFARFETVIAHYLVHKETGAYCRSVASSEFFVEDNRFSRYIRGLGAVPNNHPKLLPFLAAEVLRGRKVIIFPEGGMVKDRLVLDPKGEYNVYSRVARRRRKQHSGAAVLSLMLDAFKTGIQEIERQGDRATLERWAQSIGMESVDRLVEAAHRPTNIIPSNITFYPIRTSRNLMHRAVSLFGARLPSQFSEEMLIESNILLRDTDMDICLGDPVRPVDRWNLLHRMAFARFVREKSSLDDIFNRSPAHDARLTRVARKFVIQSVGRRIETVRDAYTREMYSNVTVNIGHLAALLIGRLVDLGRSEITKVDFHRMLYMAVKIVQRAPSIRRHRGLRNPSAYGRLLTNDCEELEEQLATAERLGLIHRDEDTYTFLPGLQRKHELDRIRLENPIAVAVNEATPVATAAEAVHAAVARVDALTERDWALMRFDDSQVRHRWDRELFGRSQHRAINGQETATESGEPFLLMPENDNGVGVVLVHGFLASPAEVRGLGETLAAAGHPVVGVRLAGHGTSPWDLRERSWQDWLDSVREGYEIMSVLTPRIALVGFSTGGTLCLLLAAAQPAKLACTVAIAPALKFMNRNMVFVPLVHGANRITEWLPAYEGVRPFQTHSSEHPHINYKHMPFRALFELRRAVDEMQAHLGDVQCPVAIYQGNKDPVVDPKGAEIIFERLGSEQKWLHRIASKRHGIVNENIDFTHEKVGKFLAAIVAEGATA